jgi:hypothetical protein
MGLCRSINAPTNHVDKLACISCNRMEYISSTDKERKMSDLNLICFLGGMITGILCCLIGCMLVFR